jgi:hypothetical protein
MDKVQKNNFTDYDAPSSEPFRPHLMDQTVYAGTLYDFAVTLKSYFCDGNIDILYEYTHQINAHTSEPTCGDPCKQDNSLITDLLSTNVDTK